MLKYLRFDRIDKKPTKSGNKINYRKFNWYLCDCGKEFSTDESSVKRGHTQSCGCSRDKNPLFKIKHGFRIGTPIEKLFYKRWMDMKNRCNCPTTGNYKYYGAKGIKVCQEWNDNFNIFKDDMYESFLEHYNKYGQKNTTLDRINPFYNYCKENCRWATQKQQSVNKRKDYLLEHSELNNNNPEPEPANPSL